MMILRILSAVTLIACLPGQRADSRTVEPKAPKITGRYVEREGQRVLYLWGSAKERGFAHGYLLAKQILEMFEIDFARVMGKRIADYDAKLTRAIVPRFKFDEYENEMLAGMLDGLRARLPEAEQKIDALERKVELVDLKAVNTFGDWSNLGCSTVALWGKYTRDGKPVVARNFDFPAFHGLLNNSFVVVNTADGDRAGYVAISHPGSIGVMTGLSAKGTWVSIHDVWVKPNMLMAMRPNVPRLCALRRLLESRSGGHVADESLANVRDWPTMFGNNFMVVAPDPAKGEPYATVLEYDNRTGIDEGATARTVDRQGVDAVEYLVCTNHHRVRNFDEGDKVSNCGRYRTLFEGALQELPRPWGVDRIFALIGSAAVPGPGIGVADYAHRELGRTFGTLHQVVAETGRRKFHVKFVVLGKNIRDAKAVTYDVDALLAKLAAETRRR